jgi:hypothetical protein
LDTAATYWPTVYQPRVIVMVIVEKLVEWRLAGETEVLGETLPQRHFVHHKSHMTRPGIEPGPPRWETSDLDIEERECMTDFNNMLHDNKGCEEKKGHTMYSSRFMTAHKTECESTNMRMNRVKNVETSITRIYSSVSLSRPFES